LQDMETGQRIVIDPAIAAHRYRRRLDDHLGKVKSACDSLGIDYQLCPTDRPLEQALLELLQHRSITARRTHKVHQQARRSP
jgi:hypothetical protein